jgi:formate dehydrogenase subunit gamma
MNNPGRRKRIHEAAMKHLSTTVSLCLLFCLAVLFSAAGVWAVSSPAATHGTDVYREFNRVFTGDWQQYGQLFTTLQAGLFSRIFLLILTIIPAIFLLHAIVVGSKQFDHTGPDVFFFSLFTRFIHWSAALSFSLLVITGLMVIFARLFGGGTPVMTAREVHLVSAIVFAVSAVPMFLIWLKDMLPMPYDILWIFIAGGYLNKKKKPVPAGKFNAGQKMWFWLATLGGGVMAYTGWHLFAFSATADDLRIMALIHNFLGAALVALFLVHLYMSLFAIKGAIKSMFTGYKPREEVEILHSRYKIDG